MRALPDLQRGGVFAHASFPHPCDLHNKSRGAAGVRESVRDNFPVVTGYSTIELSLTPGLLTHFVWLRVRIPDDAEEERVDPSRHGMLGYWIVKQ
jgi:hypothetical protein